MIERIHKKIREALKEDLERIRAEKPLIHHITNFVAMNDSANITLAIGASPVMSHAHEEVQEMVSAASALLINIGTLDEYWIRSMLLAGKRANELNIPVLLDPVGAGATNLRIDAALKLMSEVSFTIIKGNYGEILSLAGGFGAVKGVDSASKDFDADLLREFAERMNCVAVATGKYDYFSDGETVFKLENGHELLASITASGCMLGSVMASFMAVQSDAMLAAVEGAVCYAIAGEIAAEKSSGTGTFRANLMDEVAALNAETVLERMRLEEIL